MRLLVLALFFISAIAVSIPPRDAYPQIISHRGASGYVPEHSLQAYQLAIDLKTDYIEPDLCLSKDGVFMAMHDLLLDSTTDVASHPEFADRKTTKTVDGKPTEGFFISDFTYAELKTLRLLQRLPQRTPLFNNVFTLPSLAEIISLTQSSYSATNRTIGLYIELKHPSFYHKLGFKMEDMLLQQLAQAGYDIFSKHTEKRLTKPYFSPHNLTQVNPIVLQCFEQDTLVYLRTLTDVPLVQLLNSLPNSFWTNPDNFNQYTKFADALGPDKTDFERMGYSVSKQAVEGVYSKGLRLHPWTMRADMNIPSGESFQEELQFFYCCLGMDAVFVEFPDQAREAVDVMQREEEGQCPIDCSAY